MAEMRVGKLLDSGIGKSGDSPFTVKRGSKCGHRGGFTLDDASGIVVCRQCQERVEPFVALSRIAKHASHWKEQQERLRRDVERLRAVRDDLLREEQNARARLKRLTGKLRDAGGGVEVVEKRRPG